MVTGVCQGVLSTDSHRRFFVCFLAKKPIVGLDRRTEDMGTMSQLWSVFDDKFENEIVFSLNKPTRYAPRNLLGALGWPTTPQSDGRCPRQCEPSSCADLGPECFADIGACECYDIEGDPFETTSVRVGGRCEKGVYCTVDAEGNECADCCQPLKKGNGSGIGQLYIPPNLQGQLEERKRKIPGRGWGMEPGTNMQASAGRRRISGREEVCQLPRMQSE